MTFIYAMVELSGFTTSESRVLSLAIRSLWAKNKDPFPYNSLAIVSHDNSVVVAGDRFPAVVKITSASQATIDLVCAAISPNGENADQLHGVITTNYCIMRVIAS